MFRTWVDSPQSIVIFTMDYEPSTLYWRVRVHLLVLQSLNWIGHRRLDGLKTDRYKGNKDRQDACQGKYPSVQLNMIGKVTKPLPHGIPSYGRCYQQSDEHELHEIFGQKSNQVGGGSPQHLPDSNFLGALHGDICGQAKLAHTRNKDC